MKRNRGSVSIFLVIVIPVLLLGMLLVYDILRTKELESKAIKLAVACSEARLSNHNDYMLKQLGMLVYLKDDSLEQIIKDYYQKNQLDQGVQNLEIEILEFAIDDPSRYLESIIMAAPYVVGEGVVDMAIEILKGQEKYKQAQGMIREKMDRYNKLADKFSNSAIENKLKGLSDCQNIIYAKYLMEDFRAAVDINSEDFKKVVEYNKMIDNQNRNLIIDNIEIIDIYDSIWSAEELKKVIMEFDEQTNIYYRAFIEMNTKLRELEELAEEQERIQARLEHLHIILRQFNALENPPRETIEALVNQIRVEHEALMEIYGRQQKGLKGVGASAGSLLSRFHSERPFNYEKLLSLNKKLEALISVNPSAESNKINFTLEISDSQIIELKNKISKMDELEKILINEYFLTIGGSIVEQDVRRFKMIGKSDYYKNNLKGEIEYLIGNKDNDADNYKEVCFEIFAMRAGLNLVGIMSSYDKRKQIDILTAPMPYPWKMLGYGAALAAWSGAEAFYDLKTIEGGKGVHLIKKEDEWFFSLSSLLNDNIDEINISTEKSKVNHFDSRLYYHDYLRILLHVQPMDRTVIRHMNLVSEQLKKDTKDKYGLSAIIMGHQIKINGEVGYIYQLGQKNIEVKFINKYDLLTR